MPILFLTVVIDLIGFGIVIPIIPFISLKIGLNNFEIGLLIAIYSVFSGLCGPFWGRLSDKFGRKPIMLLCLAGGALGYCLLAFANSFWAILFARALGGAMAGNFGIAAAIVADITSPENRAKGMGVIGAAFGLGMTIGPFLGGVLAGDDINMMWPSFFAAGLSVLAIIAGALYLKESHPPEKRQTKTERLASQQTSTYDLLKQTQNRWLCFQYFLHNHSVSLFTYLFPLWIATTLGWGPKETGIVFGIQGLVIVAIQGKLIGPLVKLFGEIKFLGFGISFIIIGYIIAIFATGKIGILSAFYVTITGATFCMPILSSTLSKRAPEALRGRILGTATSMSAWGRMTAPLSGGVILSLSGYSLAWSLGVVVGIVYLSWVINELRLAHQAKINASVNRISDNQAE